ncbi:MAG TPA: hypothetical protein HA360_00020 [Nanoarchaeota archaeon]|nr:hypothetical protein [Candidatus Woesearchaeota archaeon]HIH15356.1 hypothetical protein [Nanoarchaeota archaeon]HIH59246.1 hypothetical protein [Nanoarchaeota archaeon]HII13439.1 hypothetical protein [Nanoarchaeota archaeon]HIJ05528.1 hypothetical protein [Nanoarchaeota archaeon]
MGYYAPQTTKAGSYGRDTYSASSATGYTSTSIEAPLQKKRPRSSGCCGRGCNPCVDDFKM